MIGGINHMCAALKPYSPGYGLHFAVGRDKSHVRGMQDLKPGLLPPFSVGGINHMCAGIQELKPGLRPPLCCRGG
jgi:hypothetical protein